MLASSLGHFLDTLFISKKYRIPAQSLPVPRRKGFALQTLKRL